MACTYDDLSALGVGSKTMIPHTPVELLMESHASDELDVLKNSETTAVDGDSTAMETADAAAMFQASHMSQLSTRSSAAMHSLMEQGTCIIGPIYSQLIANYN